MDAVRTFIRQIPARIRSISLLNASRQMVEKIVLPISKLYVERVILGPLPGTHRLARLVLRRWLQPIEPFLDRDFYLSQIAGDFARRRAARDHTLHYLLVGSFRGFAPNPDFDPLFYRATNPDLSWAGSPLMHYASRSPSHTIPTNEGQSLPPLSTGYQNGRPALLMLHHGRGGGSSRYLQLYEEHLYAQGYEIFRLERVARAQPWFRVRNRQSGLPFGKSFDLMTDEQYFLELCHHLRVSRLVVSHVVDLPPSIVSWISHLCGAAHIPFDLIIHDYLLVCPRIHLVDGSGMYCGEPAVDQCRRCIQESGSDFVVDDPATWRQASEEFVRRADRVFAPSDDVVRRLARYWPGRHITVWQPENEQEFPPPRPPSLSRGDFFRIAIIGSLTVVKGYTVILELARRVAKRQLPLKLILIGESDDDPLLRRHGVTVHGRYRDADLSDILQAQAPHIVFHPTICPETWSFVTSAALKQSLPVYAFDIGAIADRLRKLGLQTVLPLSWANEPDELISHFMSIRSHALVRNEQIGQPAVVGNS